VPKPALYLVILLCTILGALAYKLRTDTIFGCPADGYEPDQYLAYCHAADYGDYDRGAFWFDLEPQARRMAVSADVLFLGSSRMQFAFSTPATDSWFAAASASHYLLGFTATENALFAGPLLANLKPAAKVYVINLDRFFGDQETSLAREILRGEATQARFQEKRLWQAFHKRMCTAVPALCGDHFAYFRYRETGAWQNKGWDKVWKSRPKSVAEGALRDWGHWQQYPALGETFLSQLPVDHSCVVLTLVPSAMAATTRSEAATVATALGIELMVPQLEGLQTFDGSHLDRASAERWSAAFFRIAGPRIRACLERSETASPAGSAQVSRMAE
jgi:hypothetical protein